MTIPLPAPTTDPLASLVAGAFVAGSAHPIPLVETHFDIVTEAGLATVSTRRVFRNVEDESIEATITFPMPVGATLFRLEARIGERTLTATARAREEARSRYERAIDDGRAAVLHEELMRGVHMLSVAHVPPGAEITVTSEWAIALTMVAGTGRLRIPLTIGDVYGRSGLLEADAPIQGAPPQTATISVRSDAAVTRLGTGTIREGTATVPMNRPIDLEFAGWPRRPLVGQAADGRTVTLNVEPLPDGEANLNAVLLVDHSSSMDGPCSGGRRGPTKHQALVDGLQQLAAALRSTDRIDLWEFADMARPVRSSRGSHEADAASFGRLATCLSEPAGGTRIGHALEAVIEGSTAADVLLVTDGKSYDLDPHALAKAGRRVVVVLVGQDSLEAKVGHLAALTGGDIFVSDGADIARVLAAAIATLRRHAAMPEQLTDRPDSLVAIRGNARVTASWSAPNAADDRLGGRAVAAFAAGLALPAMTSTDAARLAVGEGLVTHLTSLVLVDETGTAQEGLPGMRKVALEAPMPDVFMDAVDCLMSAPPDHLRASAMRPVFRRSREPSPLPPMARMAPPPASVARTLRSTAAARGLAAMAARILWEAASGRLAAGDLSVLDADIRTSVEALAADRRVAAAAKAVGIAPMMLIVALLAQKAEDGSRSAGRLVRVILSPEALPTAIALLQELETSP